MEEVKFFFYAFSLSLLCFVNISLSVVNPVADEVVNPAVCVKSASLISPILAHGAPIRIAIVHFVHLTCGQLAVEFVGVDSARHLPILPILVPLEQAGHVGVMLERLGKLFET